MCSYVSLEETKEEARKLLPSLRGTWHAIQSIEEIAKTKGGLVHNDLI